MVYWNCTELCFSQACANSWGWSAGWVDINIYTAATPHVFNWKPLLFSKSEHYFLYSRVT